MSDLFPDEDFPDQLPHWREVEELFVSNRSVAASAAAVILRSPHDVEDVLQEALVKAAKSFHTLNDHRVAGYWFRKIVARETLDRLRQRKRLVPGGSTADLEDVWQLASQHLPPEQHAEAKEALEFINCLPERQRRAYLLRHYFGLKLREIAEVLGCAEKTVSSHLTKAQAKVDKKFKRKEDAAHEELPARLRGSRE